MDISCLVLLLLPLHISNTHLSSNHTWFQAAPKPCKDWT